jgi:hypothetical protein
LDSSLSGVIQQLASACAQCVRVQHTAHYHFEAWRGNFKQS